MVLDTPSAILIWLKLSPFLRKDLAISTLKSVIFVGVPKPIPSWDVHMVSDVGAGGVAGVRRVEDLRWTH